MSNADFWVFVTFGTEIDGEASLLSPRYKLFGFKNGKKVSELTGIAAKRLAARLIESNNDVRTIIN